MSISSVPSTPFNMPDTDDIQAKLKVEKGMEKLGNLRLSKAADPAKAKAAAEDFEATFLSQMMGHMFEGIKTDEEFGGGEAEDIYKSMMIDQYGKLIAKAGGIGIADSVYQEMMKHQELGNGGKS